MTERAMGELRRMIEQVIAFRDARNWGQFHKPKDVVISLMLEAAELAEHFQWKDEAEIRRHVAAQREALGDELADVLYWVLLLSHDLEIDLGEAFSRKMEKNAAKYPVDKARDRHTKYTAL